MMVIQQQEGHRDVVPDAPPELKAYASCVLRRFNHSLSPAVAAVAMAQSHGIVIVVEKNSGFKNNMKM